MVVNACCSGLESCYQRNYFCPMNKLFFVTFPQVDQLKMGDIVEVRGQSNEVWYAIIAESPIYGAIIAKKASKKRKISAPGANIIWLDQLTDLEQKVPF